MKKTLVRLAILALVLPTIAGAPAKKQPPMVYSDSIVNCPWPGGPMPFVPILPPPITPGDLDRCWAGCRNRPHACPLTGVTLEWRRGPNGAWEQHCTCLRDCSIFREGPAQLEQA